MAVANTTSLICIAGGLRVSVRAVQQEHVAS